MDTGVEFCPKCGNLLIPRADGKGDFVLECHYCGFSKRLEGMPHLVERDKLPPKKILGDKIPSGENEFATYSHKCQKCGHEKAQIIDVGPFYSDEDNLILLKCGKCGWSERVGEKFG